MMVRKPEPGSLAVAQRIRDGASAYLTPETEIAAQQERGRQRVQEWRREVERIRRSQNPPPDQKQGEASKNLGRNDQRSKHFQPPTGGAQPDGEESDADGNAGDGGEAEVSGLSEYRQMLIERQQEEAWGGRPMNAYPLRSRRPAASGRYALPGPAGTGRPLRLVPGRGVRGRCPAGRHGGWWKPSPTPHPWFLPPAATPSPPPEWNGWPSWRERPSRSCCSFNPCPASGGGACWNAWTPWPSSTAWPRPSTRYFTPWSSAGIGPCPWTPPWPCPTAGAWPWCGRAIPATAPPSPSASGGWGS